MAEHNRRGAFHRGERFSSPSSARHVAARGRREVPDLELRETLLVHKRHGQQQPRQLHAGKISMGRAALRMRNGEIQ